MIIFFSDVGVISSARPTTRRAPRTEKQPVHQGVTSAKTVKSGGTIIYSIGYARTLWTAVPTPVAITREAGPMEDAVHSYRPPGYCNPIATFERLSSTSEPSSGDLSKVSSS